MIRRSTLQLMGTGASLYNNSLSQFSACRQPWNDYINYLTKEDSFPYHVDPQEKPAFRGRKRGREGWLFGQQVQLHYRKFPDERIFANLQRWRVGDTVGDIALQQFRGAQPFDIENKDPNGFERPSAEVYMKLNYKNPATFSRFLTRTGHMYPMDILPMHPEAIHKVRMAKEQAVRIGLYPRHGNPFWFRSQKFRPKAYRDSYDPMSYATKHTMEHFAFNWAQTDRIKRYFQSLNEASTGKATEASSVEKKQQDDHYSRENLPLVLHRKSAGYTMDGVEMSIKNPTVPGLMSTAGMKKKFHNLYSSTSTKRMGFSNPTLGIKKV